MYIKLEDLKQLLVDPVWHYYTDHRGNTIFMLLDSCPKKKEPVKKAASRKGGK